MRTALRGAKVNNERRLLLNPESCVHHHQILVWEGLKLGWARMREIDVRASCISAANTTLSGSSPPYQDVGLRRIKRVKSLTFLQISPLGLEQVAISWIFFETDFDHGVRSRVETTRQIMPREQPM